VDPRHFSRQRVRVPRGNASAPLAGRALPWRKWSRTTTPSSSRKASTRMWPGWPWRLLRAAGPTRRTATRRSAGSPWLSRPLGRPAQQAPVHLGQGRQPIIAQWPQEVVNHRRREHTSAQWPARLGIVSQLRQVVDAAASRERHAHQAEARRSAQRAPAALLARQQRAEVLEHSRPVDLVGEGRHPGRVRHRGVRLAALGERAVNRAVLLTSWVWFLAVIALLEPDVATA